MKQDTSQPIGTPPAGGSWTWDATKGEWVPRTTPAPELQPQASAAAPADPE